MKKILVICVSTILLLGGLTMFTAKIETPFDGNDTYGFPLTFYKVYGGKRDIISPNEFSIMKLVIDVIIALSISVICVTLFIKLYNYEPRTKNNG